MSAPGPAQQTAHGHLLARIEAHAHDGDEIPCRGPDARRWIEEDRINAAFAVDQCHTCPALIPCAEYALTWQEPAGTWGGLTIARRIEIRKARTRAENRSAAA